MTEKSWIDVGAISGVCNRASTPSRRVPAPGRARSRRWTRTIKMIERMDCVQSQETLANRHLMRNKVAAFIITGGQDNVQAVANQLLGFFPELGCQFPQCPYVAHSCGWSAEDMGNNERYVRNSKALHDGTAALVHRSVDMARIMIERTLGQGAPVRGGRKDHELDTRAQLSGL